MTKPLNPVPLRADRTALREANVSSIARGLIAYANHKSGSTKDTLRRAIESVRDDSRAVAFLQRAATTPFASTTMTTFNEGVVDTTVDILGPDNAAGAIFSRAVKVSFSRENNVWVPGLSSDGSKVMFVSQNNPLRIIQYDSSKGTTLTAGMKLGFAITVTSEMLAYSHADRLLRQKMTEDIGAGLEALLFGNAAASAGVSPAGLLNNVQTVNAEATATGLDALIADLGGLASKVGATGGEIVYVGNIKETTRIKARLPFLPNVFSSGAVTSGNLIAVAPRGIAVAGSDQGPVIDTSREAVVHMDDAITNQQISTVADGFSAPVRSLFQSDSVAIRLLLPDLCWGQRLAAGTGGCVAALTGSLKW